MKSIKEAAVKGKRVLVRCDFDVKIESDSGILDDYRIEKSVSTIRWLLGQGAKVILLGHTGRPGGKVDEVLRLTPVQHRLEHYLGFAVKKTDDCVGAEVEAAVNELQDGGMVMLENVRFHPGEESNDPQFAEQLAKLGDMYVNNAFAVCHRAHASMVGLPALLPAYAGLQVQLEVETLSGLMQSPAQPLVVMIGGAKVDPSKLGVIKQFLPKADCVIVSGLIQKSIQEQEIAFAQPEKIISPSGALDALDISAEDVARFTEKILQAKTVLWNGPFGKFEDETYAKGTRELARAIIESRAYSVAGGGETAGFLHKEGLIPKFTHVSTGGGAMLSFLAGEPMPALEALEDK